MQNLKIQYSSVRRFKKDLPLLKAKKFFIGAKEAASPGTQCAIQFTLPGIKQIFQVEGLVEKVLTPKAVSKTTGKYKGMLISLTEGFDAMFTELKTELGSHEEYDEILALIEQHDEPLTWEWIQEAVSQAELEMKVEMEVDTIPPPITVKKELTKAERDKAQSAADFILKMTRAMLRSGYYDPEHPASKQSKKGIFQELQKNAATLDEIIITRDDTLKTHDMIITGVLDEPVSMRNIVGVGRAELFIPKLSEYFNRKNLVSLVIKKHVSQEHFDAFIDIMCDPHADQANDARVGATLTKAMVEKNITEISAVFMDDLIALETNLPWRVEMAIQRLAKDLMILPMFKGKTEEEIRTMKIQIVQDILRPLRHPNLLAEIVSNCYLIVKHVKDLEAHDLERTIIEAFPFSILLPTSRFIFKELENLIKEQAFHPDSKILKRRLSAIKRILKLTAKRVVSEKTPGAQKFLEGLYFNNLLTYEELPQEVQFHVNNLKLAKDIQNNLQNYITWIQKVIANNDAIILFKSFRRAAPFLIDYEAWPALIEIMKHVSLMPAHITEEPKLGCSPSMYIFQDYMDQLTEAFVSAGQEQRDNIRAFYQLLGELGILILTQVLEKSKNRRTRLAALDALSSQEEQTRNWVHKVLDDHQCPWFIHRNALMILCSVGQGDEDITRTRKYLRHGDPRIRLEALKAAIALEARDKEALIIQCLLDRNLLVQKQALNSLRKLAVLSEASVRKIVDMIQVDQSKTDEERVKYCHKNIMLIKSLAVLRRPPFRDEIEEILLTIVRYQCERKKLFAIFRKSTKEESGPMVSAALFTLQRLGNSETISSLRHLALIESPFTEPVQKAADLLEQQIAKSASGTNE